MEQVSSSLELRHAATGNVSVVVVPPRRLFSMSGVGSPQSSGYEVASRALRAAVHAVGTSLVRAGLAPPPRAAAEALWTPSAEIPADELIPSFADRRRWYWEQILAVPEAASDGQAQEAIDMVRRGAGRERPLIRVIELTEGPAAQLLALGGPTSEAAALRVLLEHAASLGQAPAGRVHLIHLTAPDLVPLDRRRTIVRIPVLHA